MPHGKNKRKQRQAEKRKSTNKPKPRRVVAIDSVHNAGRRSGLALLVALLAKPNRRGDDE